MKFRFEDMEIWKEAIVLTGEFFDMADQIEGYSRRTAEQLRAAALSVSNNIAEGAGSFSDKEFSQFLNVARRSVFECANIIHVVRNKNLIDESTKIDKLTKLDRLSRKITRFRNNIISK